MSRRVADYLVIAGMPESKEEQVMLDEYNLEVNLKTTAYQDPITDITVIIPSLGENVPDYYQLIDASPGGLSANLNHGSFRAPEIFLCFRRGRDRPPLIDLGVLHDTKDRLLPDSQIVEFTPQNHSANVNNSSSSQVFLTYRRATELWPCNALVVMDVCVIITSKGEQPPHSFMKIDKNLNKGMVGADVYICYKKSMNRADLIAYKPQVISKFPIQPWPQYEVEQTVALFCLPMGATIECWPAEAARSAALTSSFVLTLANRSKVYGSSITFYEEIETTELSEEQKELLQLKRRRESTKILVNKSICLLSQWPFFDALETFLFFLYKRHLMGPHDIPLERFISHLLYEVPFPSATRPRILLQLSPEDRIALFQPEELPLPRCGASFRNLLETCGPDNCLLLLLLALTEQKILIHSLRPSVLTSVAEALMQIIFPFYWQCPYIPLCPIGMSDYLAAPLPFVIGLDSRFFDLYDPPSDVNAIDLDTNTITLCRDRKSLSTKLMPKKPCRILRQTLVQLLDKCQVHHNIAKQRMATEDDGAIDFDFKMRRNEMELDLEIREAFLNFMVSILAGYRQFLLPITSAPKEGATDVANLFDQPGFMRSRDRSYHRFYSMLTHTQMFTKFIEERSFVSETNTCLAFFDDCVERSEHEETPKFLELENIDSDRTVFILPPEANGTDEGGTYNSERFTLNPAFFPSSYPTTTTNTTATTLATTPASSSTSLLITSDTMGKNMARRTKQEIRSAQKMAKKYVRSPYQWAKFLINTTYSIWFIHLPALMIANKEKPKTLRIGLTLLQRMHRLRLHPADEICYRVMMQLCGEYHLPVLAVKILFEMKKSGWHPNAVTYGHYNKAVLESTWHSEDLNKAQQRWNRLRNLIEAIAILRGIAKQCHMKRSRMKSLSTQFLEQPLEEKLETRTEEPTTTTETPMNSTDETTMSTLLATSSDPSKSENPKEESANDNDQEASANQAQASNPNSEEEPVVERVLPLTPEHVTDSKETESSEEVCSQRGVSNNIVRSLDEDNSDNLYDVKEDNSNADDDNVDGVDGALTKRKLSFASPSSMGSQEANVSINFEHEDDDLGVASLSDLKLEALGNDRNMLTRAEVESRSSSSSGYQRIRDRHSNLFDNKKVNRALFTIADAPQVDVTDDKAQLPSNSNEDLSQEKKNEEGTGSTVTLTSSVVVEDSDPLGALSPQPKSVETTPSLMHSHSALVMAPSSSPSRKTMADTDILGSPFASELKTQTLPPEVDALSTPSSTGLASSWRNLTKAASVSSKLNSLKKGSSYISTYLSPGSQTSKKTQDALNQGLTSIKSAYSVVSKRVEEIRDSVNTPAPSPAHSSAHLAPAGHESVNDDDGGSHTSSDSRRHSTTDPNQGYYLNDQAESWASFTGNLWDQLWSATSEQLRPNSVMTPSSSRSTKATDIMEQFELLYEKLPRSLPYPTAMEVQMTSCSKCLVCQAILYDEDIMAGWTADDSNLSTACPYCQHMVVPFLTIRIVDYRTRPMPTTKNNIESHSMHDEGLNDGVWPLISDYITVPYLSPLVLRKELESVLESEGDACLVDVNLVDSHPIIFWNLVWFFERIAVKTHLQGLCLQSNTLNPSNAIRDASWCDADHRHVRLLCRWDNERLHETGDVPLYTRWRHHSSSFSQPQQMLVDADKQDQDVRAVMTLIIAGVQANDLSQALKTMLERRDSCGKLYSPDKSSGSSTTRSPRSVYRELLFLTLTALGQDNIDLTSFDREYRRAFEQMPSKVDAITHKCDKPASMDAIFCRKLFRELRL